MFNSLKLAQQQMAHTTVCSNAGEFSVTRAVCVWVGWGGVVVRNCREKNRKPVFIIVQRGSFQGGFSSVCGHQNQLFFER